MQEKGRVILEFISTFLAERWFVVVGVLLALVIVIKIVKTVVKWVIVLALVAGLFYYGASYKDQLLELGTTAAAAVTAEVKEQALQAIQNELKDAKYESGPDGTFAVMTRSVLLEGKTGSAEVKVTFMNKTFTVNADGILKTVIEQAKQNAGL